MINISKETHPDLYNNHKKCVEFCKNIPDNTGTDSYDLIDFHMLWKEGKPFSRKQILPIKSFLATQNLNNKIFNLWSNVDLTDNEYLKPFLKYIKLQIWDAETVAKDTILESQIYKLKLTDSQCWVDGDLFRALCLYKYGGVYLDADVVFLRDFGPLLDQEFMYTWGLEDRFISGGMIRLFKHSQLVKDILHEISQIDATLNSADWSGYKVYPKVREYNKNWTIFPCTFFNTEWGISNKEVGNNAEYRKFITYPYKKTDYSNELYDGVFSWHWHSNWDAKIEKGSKWQILEKKINNKIQNKFNIKCKI